MAASQKLTLDREFPGLSFEKAEEKIIAALNMQGFGVLSNIDIQDTLKSKIGADFHRYKVLAACDPKVMHKALSIDPNVGVLLPCHIVVEELTGATKGSRIAIINPYMMLKLLDNQQFQPLVDEAYEQLDTLMLSRVSSHGFLKSVVSCEKIKTSQRTRKSMAFGHGRAASAFQVQDDRLNVGIQVNVIVGHQHDHGYRMTLMTAVRHYDDIVDYSMGDNIMPSIHTRNRRPSQACSSQFPERSAHLILPVPRTADWKIGVLNSRTTFAGAGLLIPLNKCRREELYLPWKCQDERHAYEKCQYVEFLKRVKAKQAMKAAH
eukprot:jgi/Mesvir1/7390/Mv19191-RA.1